MQKFYCTILILLFVNSFLLAQTNIPGGEVSGTWTKTNSPYLIQGAIMIANDSTLTIEPGVSVIFQGGYKFLIMGKLLAIGTQSDSITFTAADTAIGWRGIRFDNTPITNDTSKIVFCKVMFGKASGNNWDNYGGGLFFYNFSKVIILNSFINYCTSIQSGGGAYCYNSSPIISYNNLSYNTSTSNDTERGGGGISCRYFSSPIITYNTISYNKTNSGVGAGIFCDVNSSPKISNNTISNNSRMGIACDDLSNPIISYNNISMNSSPYGGGIFCAYSNPIISNNTITKNSASYEGGGIRCWGSNPTIINNHFSNNTAGIIGGGAISCNEGSNPILKENLITNNSSYSSNGGGIYCVDSKPTFYNNTITNNSSLKGGALYCDYSSSSTFHNTIIWGNTATTSGNQVYLEDETSDPNFYYCNIEGGKPGFGLNTNVFYLGTYSNNINIDPLFVDTTSTNWSLQSNSPCINAGDTSGTYPSTDKAGNPRICDGRIDIGAYEYQNGECATEIININNMNRKISIFPNPTTGIFGL